jgi:hypothetical protein
MHPAASCAGPAMCMSALAVPQDTMAAQQTNHTSVDLLVAYLLPLNHHHLACPNMPQLTRSQTPLSLSLRPNKINTITHQPHPQLLCQAPPLYHKLLINEVFRLHHTQCVHPLPLSQPQQAQLDTAPLQQQRGDCPTHGLLCMGWAGGRQHVEVQPGTATQENWRGPYPAA